MNLDLLAQRLLPEALYERLAGSAIAKRLALGSFWSLLNSLVMKTATLVQAIVLARILGITGFGEWGILLSTIAMVGVFASFGLGITTTKHVAQWHNTERERLGRLLGLLQIASFTMGILVCSILAFAARPMAEHLLAAPQLSGMLAVVGMIVLLNALASIYGGILYGLERFRDAALINGITTLAGVGLTIVLANGYGVAGAISGLALSSLLNAVAFTYWAIIILRRRQIPLYFRGVLREWGGIRDFALPTAIAGAFVMLVIWSAQVTLVRQPGGFDEMGAYQAANQWRSMIIFLPTQLLSAYLPVLSSLLGGDQREQVALQRQTLLLVTTLTLAISLPVIFAAPWLMRLYGSDFSIFWPTLAFLALIPVFDIAHVVFQQTAIVRGYAWKLLLSNIAMVGAVGFGILWIIPEYLGVGLAVTLLLGYASRVLAEYFIFRLNSRDGENLQS
jgi:O-antigen/teichoic acid export membrane protein